MTTILGDYIGFDESRLIEFKEFILKIDPISFVQNEDIKNMICTGKVVSNFNDIIIHNLVHYFKFYIPKYISAFGNMKDSEDFAHLYIGINDFGEITGIPFIGNLEPEFINDIKDSLKIFIHSKNNNFIFDKINFEIIKLSKNTNMLTDQLIDLLQEHDNKYQFAKKQYRDYISAHLKWIDKIDRYNKKLSTILTDPIYRHEVAEYIRSKTTDSSYLNIAEQLDGDHQFEILTGIEVAEQKNDKLNVYHWVTNYKDESVDNIKLQRPSRAGINTINCDDVYEHQFQMLTNLRKRFIDNNNDINYYIIKINLPTNCDDIISFTNIGCDKWYSKVRDIVNGNPCCI
jgi:hypothetical protein